MQHFDAGNYHLINIHKCLFIQCTAVVRELYGRAVCDRGAMELGYSSMKPEQVEVAVALIEGRDVFAILPTGFGKSLCYACLPVAFDKCQKKERAGLFHCRCSFPSSGHHERPGKIRKWMLYL